MLTGSLASAFYAVPRATQDIDVVIEAQREGIERLIQGLLAAGWYADRDAALEAWRGQSQFNAIEPDTGWKPDFIVRKNRAYSREEFSRRERISLIVPQCARHNVIASGRDVLKLYTIYGPPEHLDGTVHTTCAEAQAAREHFDGRTTE